MYPNLYYVLKDWFGVEWHKFEFLNTFGLMVAVAFAAAAWVISKELQRKEKQGLLSSREEVIMVGKPASVADLALNAMVGFVFGYKIIGLLFSKPVDINAQDYIFSKQGNILGGILIAALLGGLKWWDANKQKLAQPERRTVRIWPHDRVGDIIVLGLIFGILGAKLFDAFENLDRLIEDPIGTIFSASGLTFYGGLILAAIAICWYGYKKGIKLIHLVDSAAPALMIAYAIGRIGCQVAGDGDWGVYNSAYSLNENGKVVEATAAEFENKLKQNETYFLNGTVPDSTGKQVFVTNRTYPTLQDVPHKHFKGPSFLPNWMFAYAYPKNVNKDGIFIKGDNDEHNRVLPSPVIPTPFYETVVSALFFLVLWSIRKKIKVAGVMFGSYLMLNGVERFLIEKIRVNDHYNAAGYSLSQAQIIALSLIISGIILIGWVIFANKKNN
jgi:phosphatidylglycerol---prolipoprotein diacylglyceryl transferase